MGQGHAGGHMGMLLHPLYEIVVAADGDAVRSGPAAQAGAQREPGGCTGRSKDAGTRDTGAVGRGLEYAAQHALDVVRMAEGLREGTPALSSTKGSLPLPTHRTPSAAGYPE